MASYQFFLVLGLLAFACAHTPATMIVGDNEAGNGKIYNNNYLSNGRFKQPSFTGAFNIYTDNAAAPWFAKEI